MVPERKKQNFKTLLIWCTFFFFVRNLYLRVLACSEKTVDVHSLLLSISPHPSHGLDREEGGG